ncbi:molybdenum cofactor guanylyltransferase [Dyadobacter aurulentus]|uniref:molybdenum cofactor guanylyltransferase n=1 Tax=Dyadobacter sp. UC 10 TaxID=2605428 RepID=UPI0011F2D9B8|nr:molybdenum cofactor guanylyltransferase [Dyadobacter sp. UC 10]KAA0991707.1 molybdenum cofactor guanylyltransferase [Dyadobacter sp. UC 10]
MGLIGIVVCGGESSRMGTDKSQLVYFEKPQYEHVADLLSGLCNETVISCNAAQIGRIETEYQKLIDLPQFSNIGPIGALLTAFHTFPENDFLFIGCDYPLLAKTDISLFYDSIQEDSVAAAFYNKHEKYEPLLSWYSSKTGLDLFRHFKSGDLSLQSFLRNANADKYIPKDETVMQSVDTPEDSARVTEFLKQKYNG